MTLHLHDKSDRSEHHDHQTHSNRIEPTEFDDSKPHEYHERKDSNDFCKKITKFLFSHIGLVIMVIIYAVAGAFLFQLLEQHQDAMNCQEGKGEEETNIVDLRSRLLKYIQFNITMGDQPDPNKDNETVANSNIENWLMDYRDKVLTLRSTYFYTGQDCSTTRWDFGDALLFAVTVITTIGYGNIAPSTWEGQITCICYATLGIPLFLMCLANISGVLGDMFRYTYAHICCGLCRKKKKAKNEIATQQTGNQISAIDDKNGAKVVDDNDELENDINEREEKVTVPLTITMIIITGYVLIGAVLFNSFEGWGMIPSGYFCYITLATIGFGDYVPGQNTSDPNRTPKLIGGAIYVLIGMSILAMCFDLMQEEIITKFTWLGKKLGIIEKDEEEEESNTNNNPEQLDKKEATATKEEKNNSSKSFRNLMTPVYVNDPQPANKFDTHSPAPSYSAYDPYDIDTRSKDNYSRGASNYSRGASFNRDNLNRDNSAYLQNVVQRQYKP